MAFRGVSLSKSYLFCQQDERVVLRWAITSFLSFQPCAAFHLLELHMSRAGSKWGVGFSFQHCSGNDRMQHRWNKLVYTECAGVIDEGQLHPSLKNTLCPGILSFTPRLAVTCKQTTFWNTTTLKEKSWVFFSPLPFLFYLFFKQILSSHVQLR